MVAQNIKVLNKINGFEELKERFNAIAKECIDENGKPLPLTENQKKEIESLLERTHKSLVKAVGQEVNENGPLSMLTLTPRDESQSGMKAMSAMGEKMMVYQYLNFLISAGAEVDGGRFGAEAGLMLQGKFPAQERKYLEEKLSDVTRILLTRSSAFVGFSKYHKEDQKFLAQNYLADYGADLIRTFSSPNSTNDMFPHLEALAEAGLRFMPAVAFATSKTSDAFSAERMSDFLSRVSDKSLALTKSLNKGGQLEIKDFSDRMPANAKVRDSEKYKENPNAVTTDELVPEILNKVAPGVELYLHTHNTVGYGAEKAVEALKNGAKASSVAISPSNELAQPDIFDVLEKMEKEGMGEVTAYERGVLEMISVFNTEFIQVKNESFIAPKVTERAKQGVIDTTAPGGGYGAVAAAFDELIYENADGLKNAQKILEANYGGKSISTDGVEPEEIKKQARQRIEDIYFDTLENYRKMTGEYGLVTPYYANVSELVVQNIDNVLDEDKSLNFDDIQKAENISLTPATRNMLTGRADEPPISVDQELKKKAIKELVSEAAKEFRIKTLPKNLLDSLEEVNKKMNEDMQYTKDVLYYNDWKNDIEEIIDSVENDSFDFDERLNEKEQQEFLKYYKNKLKTVSEKLDKSVKTYRTNVLDGKENSNVIRDAEHMYEVHVGIHTHDAEAYKYVNTALQGELTEFRKATGNRLSKSDVLKIVSAAMEVKVNPTELLPVRKDKAKEVLDSQIEKGEEIHDPKEAHALYTLGQVSLNENGPGIIRPVTKFDPVNVINNRNEANQVIKGLREDFKNMGFDKKQIDNVLNKEFTEFATLKKLAVLYGRKKDQAVNKLKDVASNSLNRDLDPISKKLEETQVSHIGRKYNLREFAVDVLLPVNMRRNGNGKSDIVKGIYDKAERALKDAGLEGKQLDYAMEKFEQYSQAEIDLSAKQKSMAR